MTENEVSYEVVVTGDCAPYLWEVWRTISLTRTKVHECKGQAESLEEACLDASAAAHQVEAERRWKATIRKVPLFSAPTEPVVSGVDDEMVKHLEEYDQA